MKKTNKTLSALAISLAANSLTASGAIIIAGIDTWDNTATPTVSHTAAGVAATATASASTGSWSTGDSSGRGSSKDTTWGTFDGNGIAASDVTNVGAANFTVTNGRPSAEVTLSITNNGTVDLDLAAFHLDVVGFRPNAPRAYALNVLAGSDITVGNVFTSADDAITHLGGGLLTDDGDPLTHDQHDDLDLDLGGLADHTLAVGESAQIQIAFSSGTGSGGGHHLFLDNVAVSGDAAVVPEPSSFLLLGLSGYALLCRRRR
ncbi:PEP-CTERM sorting domain-containing protein [bacterium]|nr:PEP-CTERM sorting domain-containing protein [bacterium]